MGRTAKSAQGARAGERDARIAKARQRRLELDKDKEARGARIDQAVADVYLAQDERDEAGKVVEAADAKIGAAIARILAERVPMAQVAELTEMSVNQVQKLKAATVEPTEPGAGGRAEQCWPVSECRVGEGRADRAGVGGRVEPAGDDGVLTAAVRTR
jgi:hypothetical protein